VKKNKEKILIKVRIIKKSRKNNKKINITDSHISPLFLNHPSGKNKAVKSEV